MVNKLSDVDISFPYDLMFLLWRLYYIIIKGEYCNRKKNRNFFCGSSRFEVPRTRFDYFWKKKSCLCVWCVGLWPNSHEKFLVGFCRAAKLLGVIGARQSEFTILNLKKIILRDVSNKIKICFINNVRTN